MGSAGVSPGYNVLHYHIFRLCLTERTFKYFLGKKLECANYFEVFKLTKCIVLNSLMICIISRGSVSYRFFKNEEYYGSFIQTHLLGLTLLK